MTRFLEYEVKPGDNVAQGMPRLRLPVLSPIWQGPALVLEYADGEVHTLVGWTASDEDGPGDLQVFWTRHQPEGPAVCLVIGGDAGLRDCRRDADGVGAAHGLPLLALAASLIPPAVLTVIGPPPEMPRVEKAPLLLL